MRSGEASGCDVAVLLLVQLDEAMKSHVVLVYIARLGRGRLGLDRDWGTVVPAVDRDYGESVVAFLAIARTPWELAQLLDDSCRVPGLIVQRYARGCGGEAVVVETRTYERLCHVDHCKARSNGVRRVPVNRKMTGVELVVEPGPGLGERSHASLGFQCDVDRSDRQFHEPWKIGQFRFGARIEDYADLDGLLRERGRGRTAGRHSSGSADHQVEILPPARPKVTHLVIEAIPNEPSCRMVPQQCTVSEEIEQDGPASDL